MNWPHYDSGFAKIFCGGSWETDGDGGAVVTLPARNTPSVQDRDVGFRCARRALRTYCPGKGRAVQVRGRDLELSRSLY